MPDVRTGSGEFAITEAMRALPFKRVMLDGEALAHCSEGLPATRTLQEQGTSAQALALSRDSPGPFSRNLPRGVEYGHGRPRELERVSPPVSRFLSNRALPATSESEKVRFNQLNKNTGNRIRYVKVDAETGDEVDSEDIIKGYQVGLPDTGDARRGRVVALRFLAFPLHVVTVRLRSYGLC